MPQKPLKDGVLLGEYILTKSQISTSTASVKTFFFLLPSLMWYSGDGYTRNWWVHLQSH